MVKVVKNGQKWSKVYTVVTVVGKVIGMINVIKLIKLVKVVKRIEPGGYRYTVPTARARTADKGGGESEKGLGGGAVDELLVGLR